MLNQILNITQAAGRLARELRSSAKASQKSDESWVTTADVEVEHFIVNSIRAEVGLNHNILAEEDTSLRKDPEDWRGKDFWAIDPIDATASYIEGTPFYCVNIARIKNDTVDLGVIYAPELNTLWYAQKGQGAFKLVEGQPGPIKLKTRTPTPGQAVAVTSKLNHHINDELRQRFGIGKEEIVPSAVKFCYIAEGKADYYFRKKNVAKDWDIAAGVVILEEAGGSVDWLGETYSYGQPPYVVPSFIAMGTKS